MTYRFAIPFATAALLALATGDSPKSASPAGPPVKTPKLLFDLTGKYDAVWGICILLGILSALIHLPIDERSLEARRLAAA